MTMVKKASIFKLPDYYIVHSSNTTTVGYSIASEPYLRVKINAPLSDITEAVIKALNDSKTGVYDNARKDDTTEYLGYMGFKSMKELHKNSIHCFVYEKEDKIYFLPTVNSGSRQGFTHLPEKKLLLT